MPEAIDLLADHDRWWPSSVSDWADDLSTDVSEPGQVRSTYIEVVVTAAGDELAMADRTGAKRQIGNGRSCQTSPVASLCRSQRYRRCADWAVHPSLRPISDQLEPAATRPRDVRLAFGVEHTDPLGQGRDGTEGVLHGRQHMLMGWSKGRGQQHLARVPHRAEDLSAA
jgi:hypothetical protein